MQIAKKGLYDENMKQICLKSVKLKNIASDEAEQIGLWTTKIKIQSIEIKRLANLLEKTIRKLETGGSGEPTTLVDWGKHLMRGETLKHRKPNKQQEVIIEKLTKK